MRKDKLQFWETLCKWLIRIFCVANAKGSLCCFFCFDLSESSRSLGSGKCSSYSIASKLLLKNDEHPLIISWSPGSGSQPLLLSVSQLDSKTLKKQETCIPGFINVSFVSPIMYCVSLPLAQKHRFHKTLALSKLCYCIVWTREFSTVYLFILALVLWLSMHF